MPGSWDGGSSGLSAQHLPLLMCAHSLSLCQINKILKKKRTQKDIRMSHLEVDYNVKKMNFCLQSSILHLFLKVSFI